MTQAENEPRPEVRLLRAATVRIATFGLDGLDVRTLADEAGTSTSQFARHYRHKDELIAAVFDQGWLAIERHILPRLFRPSGSIEDFVEAILSGALDALASDREVVSAALIIAHASVGQSVKKQLKTTDAHSRFFTLVTNLRSQFAQLLTQDEAMEVLELLYGAALHRLVLSTPLCEKTAPPFNREVFMRMMQRMARSLIDPGKTSNPTS